MSRRAIRIAAFSGALGDYAGAFAKAVHGDPAADVLIGDYLAEITMGRIQEQFIAAAKPEGSKSYFVSVFLQQLEPELATIAIRKMKIVVNAGAFNPQGLVARIESLVRDKNLALKIACVGGDDLLPRLPELAREDRIVHLDSGRPLGNLSGRIVAANAYLGGWGIAAALAAGADIVICGRVTDAALVAGPAAWWHGWQREDWNSLAGAIVAGHIIECGPQAMGGNFSGFTALPRDMRLGFPVAEIEADGSAIITKRGDEGGAVTTDTVTAQLLYEIQGPRYLNPDAILHMDSVRVSAVGPDRVRISQVQGGPAPAGTKVGCYYQNGYRTMLWAYITGIEWEAKTAWLRQQMQSIADGLALDDYRFEVCGKPVPNPGTKPEATIAIRIAAAAQDKATLARFAAGYSSFGLGGFPGFHGDSAGIHPRIEYWPGLVAQNELQQLMTLGQEVQVIPLPQTQAFAGMPGRDPGVSTDLSHYGPTRRAPLGEVILARSGDKGGDANLGIWCSNPAAYPWLAAFLTEERASFLLDLPQDVTAERYLFPNVHGILLVLKNYFGPSGTGNIGLDQIGKAIGEFLRARDADIPVAFLLLRKVDGEF